ncbi:hypothetical protein GCM10007972_03390 [Iodidimonas muriae]|uniref:Radical SAM core domain-containing protein n=1 Tax=Iodidimonas muriae TaxID=261467 RepID=A0ABQ2L783_9PROT|nr:radical SAM protein [Iodidimonas muriae]GER08355.1 hypothetical protein JCM17843_26650 [Kordiimonadales bacterium JCM 17843]GGO05727.1 hypothetical protein GCM10007972_03390 [Iodidimonas muriae]
MPDTALASQKFTDPVRTAKGETRATVYLRTLETLWFNTGTLCNLACANCYIESTPKNDSLVYLSAAEVERYLDEIALTGLGTREIGLTGGEPFMNPDCIKIMDMALSRGFKLLVLSNAMKPMQHKQAALLDLHKRFGDQLSLRISVDHFTPELHEEERGPRSFAPMLEGLEWLSRNGFNLSVAGRTRWTENEADLRRGYEKLFKAHGIEIDAHDPVQLILFPEMDDEAEVPEITTKCWNILHVNPDDMMCATSRMVVKRKGDDRPSVQACTLLAYDQRFNLGETLAEAAQDVPLNHPHCAKFCVLGGGSCSG